MVSPAQRWQRSLLLWIGWLGLVGWSGLGWAGSASLASVLALPAPAGFQQAVLRLANPAVDGYWLVRWLQPIGSVYADEHVWQQQLRQHYGLQTVSAALWFIPATAGSQAVLLQRKGAAWLLSQWQPEAGDPAAWQALRTLEVSMGSEQLLSDWLTEVGETASRQQIWRQAGRSVAQWRAELSQRWQGEGWRPRHSGPSIGALNMQAWQRGNLERLALWLPQGQGGVLLLTHQAVARRLQ